LFEFYGIVSSFKSYIFF